MLSLIPILPTSWRKAPAIRSSQFRRLEADLLAQAHGIGGDAKMVQAGDQVALGNGRADDLHQLDVAGQQILDWRSRPLRLSDRMIG